jgi:endogenous inhibitor of DNA gyrase (YacG/DUF329 family)
MSAPKPQRCPMCGRPTDQKYRPFCSARCKQLDLARWLNEGYRVPVVEEDDEPSEKEEGEEESES